MFHAKASGRVSTLAKHATTKCFDTKDALHYMPVRSSSHARLVANPAGRHPSDSRRPQLPITFPWLVAIDAGDSILASVYPFIR